MDTDKLEKNLMDMLMEQQAKIGFLPETVRLYYPLESLNRMLKTDLSADEMFSFLSLYGEGTADRFHGRGIQVTNEGDRFCLILPPEMSAQVHAMTGQAQNRDFLFIRAFVDTISRHGCTIEELKELFEASADDPSLVRVESFPDGDFDYLFFFENGIPDSYRYCITCEGPHLIYHRYTPEDFAALMGE